MHQLRHADQVFYPGYFIASQREHLNLFLAFKQWHVLQAAMLQQNFLRGKLSDGRPSVYNPSIRNLFKFHKNRIRFRFNEMHNAVSQQKAIPFISFLEQQPRNHLRVRFHHLSLVHKIRSSDLIQSFLSG